MLPELGIISVGILYHKKGSVDWNWLLNGLAVCEFYLFIAKVNQYFILIPLLLLLIIYGWMSWKSEALLIGEGIALYFILAYLERIFLKIYDPLGSILSIFTMLASNYYIYKIRKHYRLEISLSRHEYKELLEIAASPLEVGGLVSGDGHAQILKEGTHNSVVIPIKELTGKWIKFIFHTHPISMDIPSTVDASHSFIPAALTSIGSGVPYITFYFRKPFLVRDCRIVRAYEAEIGGKKMYIVRRPLISPCIAPLPMGRIEHAFLSIISQFSKLIL